MVSPIDVCIHQKSDKEPLGAHLGQCWYPGEEGPYKTFQLSKCKTNPKSTLTYWCYAWLRCDNSTIHLYNVGFFVRVENIRVWHDVLIFGVVRLKQPCPQGAEVKETHPITSWA